MVVGASYANAELALALGIASGIGKTVIILQEEDCQVLSDMKTLTKTFRGMDDAVDTLKGELKEKFPQRCRKKSR
jgi:hypothetical protein